MNVRVHRTSSRRAVRAVAVPAASVLLGNLFVGCLSPAQMNGRVPGDFTAENISKPVVRVLLPVEEDRITVRSECRMIVRVQSNDGSTGTYFVPGKAEVRYGKHGIAIRDENGARLEGDLRGLAIECADARTPLAVNGEPYFGVVAFNWTADGTPRLINRLNIDLYLRGVLPPELGSRKPSEIEAIKAQAVAARTYALAHLGQYPNADYDLRPGVADQIYIGAKDQRPHYTEAIEATRGEVLRFGEQLISAYYHSTCGGRTDDIEAVWEKPAAPYLKAAVDDTFCRWSKYTHWREEWSHKELVRALRAWHKKSGATEAAGFKHIRDIIPSTRRTDGGRLERIIVVTDKGRWTIYSDRIRWALGRPTRPGSILESSNCNFEIKRDRKGRIRRLIATGMGYGHGVGMCQCGMIGRARAGQNYRDILQHYYRDVSVDRVY